MFISAAGACDVFQMVCNMTAILKFAQNYSVQKVKLL